MADWSPPRAGVTRTGKSLKAVRRYYAMKDAGKRKRSPDAKEEEDRNSPQHSISKRKRSPDDDKLSKRIAAELKVQQEANEKRTRQVQQQQQQQQTVSNSPTDRSALPQFMQREIGPTFVTETQNETASKSPNTNKSYKSVKSIKSMDTYKQIPSGHETVLEGPIPGRTSLGWVLTCFTLGVVYLITWIFMLLVEEYRSKKLDPKIAMYSSLKSVGWLAIGSIIVILTVPYWILCRQKFKHALVTLALMVVSTTNLAFYLIYTLVIEERPAENIKFQDLSIIRNSLNFWLPITYLICHFIADGVMIRHTLLLVSRQIEVKLSDTQMSQYLSPHK